MQHFGTKNALFRAATAMDIDVQEAFQGSAEDRNQRVLRHTLERLDAHPQAAASTLRTMLTHDDVADEALGLFNPPMPAGVAGSGGSSTVAADDPGELRRWLVTALVLGTAITRYVLTAPAVRDASLADLIACLLPAVDALDPPGDRR